MVKLGIANSRMKDYHDIWVLSREFAFEGDVLSQAVRATFRRRRTALLPGFPVALSVEFSADAAKRRQWEAFVRRGRLKVTEHDLAKVIEAIRLFLGPAIDAAAAGVAFKAQWPKGGTWQTQS